MRSRLGVRAVPEIGFWQRLRAELQSARCRRARRCADVFDVLEGLAEFSEVRAPHWTRRQGESELELPFRDNPLLAPCRIRTKLCGNQLLGELVGVGADAIVTSTSEQTESLAMPSD